MDEFEHKVNQTVDRIRKWVLELPTSPAKWPDTHPINQKYWVPSDGTFEMVSEMTREYGLDHLQEAAWALQGLGKRAREAYRGQTKLGVGLNAGGGLVELFFRLVGIGGEKTLLIDYCDACGEYASQIFGAFGQRNVEFVNSSTHMKRIPQIEPNAMLSASHALNVQNREEAAQQRLVDTNSTILDSLAFGTVDETFFFSLEPEKGLYGIDFLMEKFREAGHDTEIVPYKVLNHTYQKRGQVGGSKNAMWGVARRIEGRLPIRRS